MFRVCRLHLQVKEAVAEAEASLPELVTVIPAGVDNQRVQEAVQAFLGSNIFAVRVCLKAKEAGRWTYLVKPLTVFCRFGSIPCYLCVRRARAPILFLQVRSCGVTSRHVTSRRITSHHAQKNKRMALNVQIANCVLASKPRDLTSTLDDLEWEE